MLHNSAEQDPNELTLNSYNAQVWGYIKHTPANYQSHHAPLLKWINESLALLPKNAHILEIGSGTGRDARYIEGQGYKIVCSDGAYAFTDYLRGTGWEALQINILKNTLPGNHDMILANAVMSHFTHDQFQYIFEKVMDALPLGGLFAFSVKQGVGEKWITEKFKAKRFIHYWNPTELKKYIEAQNYEITFWEED